MTQTIRRAPRRQQWVTIEQRAVEDARLSWAARGLLVYLLSRPNDWQVRVKDLQRRGDLKRDGIYKLLGELRRYGYVEYETVRGPRGQLRKELRSFSTHQWLFSEQLYCLIQVIQILISLLVTPLSTAVEPYLEEI